MNLIVKLFLNAVVAYGASMILSGVHIRDFVAAIWFSLLLSVLNTFIKPLLILFTLPITVFTLGIFLFFINTIIILIADWLMDSIQIDGFLYALIFSFVLSAFSTAIDKLFANRES